MLFVFVLTLSLCVCECVCRDSHPMARRSEIYMGHTTWEAYTFMLPVFKWYNIPMRNGTRAATVAMSTYPGPWCSVSLDFPHPMTRTQ